MKVLSPLLLLLAKATAAADYPAPVCNVVDFGARGDNTTDDAPAVRRAIAAAPSPCATILFPRGRTFVLGSVPLRNGLTVAVEGAIRAAPNGQHAYDCIEHNPWAHYQDFGHTYFRNSLFWGISVENVTVTGGGTIWGDALTTGETAPGDGNKMFAFRSSKNVRLERLRLIRGGWFTVIVTDVDGFIMVDTEIQAARDGIDICQCRHVRITRCHIHGGGDDALVLKSDYSTGPPKPSFDLVISNSVVGSPGASALRFGSETVGEMYDIRFENITVTSAAKAAIGIVSMDGAHIHDVLFRNIIATHAGIPFFFYIGARNRRPPAPSGAPHLGSISRVTVESFSGTQLGAPNKTEHPFWSWPATLDGQDVNATWNVSRPVPVREVLLRDVFLVFPGGGTANLTRLEPPHWANEYEPWRYCARAYCPDGLSLPAYGFFIRHTTGLVIDNLRIAYAVGATEQRPPFIIEDSQNITILHTGREDVQRPPSLDYDVGLRNTPLSEVRTDSRLVVKTL